MLENYRIVAVTPAGRERYLEILLPYILENRPVIDEYHLWVNTNNEADIAYMKSLGDKYPDFIKLYFLDTPANGNETIRYFFQYCTDVNTIYVRIDDDICLITENAITELVNFRIKYPEYFIIYANILNNSICSYINQRRGSFKDTHGKVTYDVFCDIGWKSGKFAESIHYQFLHDYQQGNIKHYEYPFWILSDFERVSVNFIAWFGKDFAEFDGIVEGVDEEEWLSVDKPKQINRYNCICGTSIVSHFSYFTQREYLENHTDVLQRYKKLADKLLMASNFSTTSELISPQDLSILAIHDDIDSEKQISSHTDQQLAPQERKKRLIIFQSGWNWDFLWNRFQPLAQSLSEYCTVIYLDAGFVSATAESQKIGELIQLSNSLYRYVWYAPDGYSSCPWFWVLNDRNTAEYQTLLSDISQLVNGHEEVWLYNCRPALEGLLDLIQWDNIIVDVEDPWLSLDWGIKIQETGVLDNFWKSANVIFANGKIIAEEYQPLVNKTIHSLPNGVDDALVKSLSISLPYPKFINTDSPRHKAIFTGFINNRVNFDLLREVVIHSLDFDFYFVGMESIPNNDLGIWNELKSQENFYYIPPVNHEEISGVLQAADVLILPYKTTTSAQMFPAKIYEYLAAQKIIASSIDFSIHSEEIPSLITYDSAQALIDILKSVACQEISLSNLQKQKCQQIAFQNTWNKRAKELLRIAHQENSNSQKITETKIHISSIPKIEPVLETSRPFWSVMIPTYNCAEYLRETLKSVLAQDPGAEYMQIEVIDDFSTKDDSEAVVREIGEGRVTFYRQPQNSGIAINFTTCIQRAKGQWVHILHGDDMVAPGFYRQMQASLEKQETVGAAFCRQIFVDENTQWQGLSYLEQLNPGILTNFIERLAIAQRIETPSIVVRRDVYEKLGGFHLELSHAADWEMWKRIATYYPVWYEPQPLVYYRRHGASDTSRLLTTGANVVDKRKSIEITERYLPRYLAKTLSDQARRVSAIAAIQTAKHMLFREDKNAAIAQIYQGLQCSEHPNVISSTINLINSRKELLQDLINLAAENLGNTTSESAIIKIQEYFNNPITSEEAITTNIIIDGVAFQVLEPSGISRVWTSLLEAWVESGFAQHLMVLNRGGTAPIISGIRYIDFPAYSYGNIEDDRNLIQEVCDKVGAEIFISTYHTTTVSTPTVFLAHDMIPEAMGWNLAAPMWREKHRSILAANAYIAVSENTANDLVKFFPRIPRESVTVAKNGVNHQIFTPSSVEEISKFQKTYGIRKPYFLLVGIDDERKNRNLFFQAFSQLVNKDGFEIVITGSNSLIDAEIRQYTLGTTIHNLYLDDEELVTAYGGAIALVYPSKYEGFGLPIIEAMACGCPVITCPHSAILEVGADAAIYVNPQDINGLADALMEVQKPSIRKRLIAAGLNQSAKFSWLNMADIISQKLLDMTLPKLNLKTKNFIIFPDWQQSEEIIGEELQGVIRAIATNPDSENITLLIETSQIPPEDAELFISSVTMGLLMEEDIDISEGLGISLVDNLSENQWESLLTQIQGRIALIHEDKEKMIQVRADNLVNFALDNLENISDNIFLNLPFPAQ
ncbi:glycosyltransferase [Calothrix sp. 336/3]|uniref:glycosyltransferase n=1 Tax=Calothrix sp. 336/3 TaxID=1337936 RepID=UPI00069B3354|nr:glycosyltransferase [Calothrix sp. 336/3]